MTVQYRAYIASPLTGLDGDAKVDLERKLTVLKRICSDYNIEAYIPGQFTDPDRNPDIKPYIVYQTDRDKVRSSDLFVLLALKPSFGAGQEVEIAYNSLIPMIIIHPQDSRLSRMVEGVPTKLKYIMSFEDENSLEGEFKKGIALLKPHIERRQLELANKNHTIIGETISSLRDQKGLKLEELASELGISEDEIRFIESGSNFAVNPSFALVSKIAEVLRVDPAEILFKDFYNSKMTELTSKFVEIIKKLPYTDIIGARNTKHAIKDEDIIMMIMRLAMEEK